MIVVARHPRKIGVVHHDDLARGAATYVELDAVSAFATRPIERFDRVLGGQRTTRIGVLDVSVANRDGANAAMSEQDRKRARRSPPRAKTPGPHSAA